MIFRAFQDRVCTGLSKLAEQFTGPEDDWASLAFFEDHAGEVTVVPVGSAIEHPDVLVAISQRKRARKLATSACGLVCVPHAQHARASTRPSPSEGPTLPVEGLEVLWVLVLDEERIESWIAPISREPTGPPTLGEWVYTGEPAGILIDPLRHALR
jgi:hypothetical protein